MIPTTSVLQLARLYGSRFFYGFGIHIATHQIRVILISCVVITSLFYPALSMYAASQTQPTLHSTSRFLAPFLAIRSVSGFTPDRDLQDLWTGHSSLRLRPDASPRNRCGLYQTLRVERLLIQSPLVEDASTLNHHILQSTLLLEQRIAALMPLHGISCVHKDNGECFVLSPLLFWNYDGSRVLADDSVLDTLDISKNTSIGDIFVTPQMVLAGRGADDSPDLHLESATYLAVTYFMPENDCLGNSDHTLWVGLVRDAVGNTADITPQTQAPTLLAIEYDVDSFMKGGLSPIRTFVYMAYLAFFVYVTWSMRRMQAVHSRIGLTFTALVEIAVSTVTSLSVLALVRFKVTLVPWELLPIVIVFVGAENMFNLVDAVVKTSVALPVKLRCAEGLSRAGTSNTLKVVSYNSILGTMAVFAGGAVRQFCVFAVVVLVAHWFLAHTFFMTVLSIDIQRLELEELLRQNSLTPQVLSSATNASAPQSTTKRRRFFTMVENLLKGRAAKNISLFLLLAMAGILYYTTHPASRPRAPHVVSTGALSRTKAALVDFTVQTPARRIWNLLNPMEDDILHIRVEAPTVLVFGSSDRSSMRQMTQGAGYRLTSRTLTLLFSAVKIIVLPISITTTFLYGLLRYLLKDADLLEAQRNKTEGGATEKKKEGPTLEAHVSFTTLTRAFPADVELLAASADGKIVAGISLRNEFVVWDLAHKSHLSIDTTDVLLRSASTSSATSDLTAVAVDDAGKFCAVGTGCGVVAIWSIGNNAVHPLPHLSLENSSFAVSSLHFFEPLSSETEAGKPQNSNLLVVFENAVAAVWTISNDPVVTFVTPSSRDPIDRCIPLRMEPEHGLFICFSFYNGDVELVEITQHTSAFPSECILHAGLPSDRVAKVHGCCLDIGNQSRIVVGTVTDSGVVSLWDARTGECFSTLEDMYGTVNTLRIFPLHRESCHFCGELPLDGFFVSFSIGHVVLLYQIQLSSGTRHCSCSTTQLSKTAAPRDIGIGRHSRSGSFLSSAETNGPSHARLKPGSPGLGRSINLSPFPVSGHGVHSRRTSDKDPRRAADISSLQPTADERECDFHSGRWESAATTSSFWREVIVRKVADFVSERGNWDICGKNIIGVRRRPRSREKPPNGAVGAPSMSSTRGLTAVVLDRWEFWLFETFSSCLRTSSLLALHDARTPAHCSTDLPPPPSSDGIPRLPFTRVQPFLGGSSYGVAGFGNTVGLFSIPSL